MAYHRAIRTRTIVVSEVGLEYQGIWDWSTRVIGVAAPGYLGKKLIKDKGEGKKAPPRLLPCCIYINFSRRENVSLFVTYAKIHSCNTMTYRQTYVTHVYIHTYVTHVDIRICNTCKHKYMENITLDGLMTE